MKAPSKDISMSLTAQKGAVGRTPKTVAVSGLKRGVSLTVPGDADVHLAPGTDRVRNGERCACKYVEPMGRFGGKDTPGFP